MLRPPAAYGDEPDTSLRDTRLDDASVAVTAVLFNLAATPAKFARIASAMGRFVDGMPQLDAAREAVRAIRELCLDLGIPTQLRDIGATEDMLEEMAQQCANAGYNRWNPRHTSLGDFSALFRKTY